MVMSGESLLVLVVEDEFMLLMNYENAIEDAGCRYLSASTLGEGVALISDDIDVAILDIRLGEERVFPLAYKLVERGIPFLFCSGTATDMPDGMFSEVPLMNKPVNANLVVGAAIELASR